MLLRTLIKPNHMPKGGTFYLERITFTWLPWQLEDILLMQAEVDELDMQTEFLEFICKR